MLLRLDRQIRPGTFEFQPTDFDYDPDQLRCTWPAGKTMYRNGANVTIKGRRGIKFNAPKPACEDCHLRAPCLRDTGQKSPRQVVFFREPTPTSTSIERMKAKIDSINGRTIYSKRLGTVEPRFRNLRYHKGLDRFTMRGKDKVDGQWKLYALVHNIEKLAHRGTMA